MFCPKCGKEIPNQAAFCPKCGAPLKAAGPQPAPAPEPVPAAAPAASGNKWALARSMASPAQRKADKVHLGILLADLILAGLWLAGTMVMIDRSDEVWSFPYTICDFLNGIHPGIFICTFVLGLLIPVISNLFLTRHMLKQDGKVNGSILSWLYLIWSAGIYGGLLYTGVRTVADDDLLSVVPSALGWLYIACCVVLLALLVYLSVLRSKAAKERKAQGTL